MKRAIKIVLITGIVLIVIGIIAVINGMAKNSWKFSTIKYEYFTETLENTTDLTVKANINGESNIITEFYDGDSVLIEYAKKENYRDGKITKTGEGSYTFEEQCFNNSNFGFTLWFQRPPATTIKIPAEYALNITFETVAGSVELADGNYGNLTFDLAAGNVEADAITAESICVKLDAGNFQAKEITVANTVETELSAGNFQVDKLTCPSVQANLSMGNFSIKKLVCDSLNAKLSMGNLNCNVVGAESEYTVKSQCNMGNCNIGDRQGDNPDKLINVNVDMGNITVKFISE